MISPADMERVVKNLDLRVRQTEQILPTLATKEDVRTAISEAVAPLATKEEVRTAISQAIAPLATKEELRAAIAPLATRAELHAAIAAESERTRTFVRVMIESVRDDIRLLAEGHVALRQDMAEFRSEVNIKFDRLDARVTHLEASRVRRR
jgi:hypothetical protein